MRSKNNIIYKITTIRLPYRIIFLYYKLGTYFIVKHYNILKITRLSLFLNENIYLHYIPNYI